MARTTFVGVSEDEVAHGNTGLYEFTSAEGHHVYLHDAELLALTHQPGPVPRLRTTFRYDAEWVPDSLRATPLIVIDFEGVRVVEWEEDEEATATLETNPDAAAAAGQVSCFDWDGGTGFNLFTFTVSLTFTATKAEVNVRSKPR